MRFFLPNIPQWLVKLFGLEIFNREVTDYFKITVENIVKYREENNITRGDFLDSLITMKNRTDTEKLEDLQESSELTKFMDQIGEKCNKNNVGRRKAILNEHC